MKIATFDGGQSSRLSPNLIQPNEAVKYINVDNTRGILEPVKGKLFVQKGRRSIYKFKGEWVHNTELRDYTEYQNKLYWTTEGRAQKYNGTVQRNLGITAHFQKVNVTVTNIVPAPVLEDGTFQYVITYYNSTDGTESPPNPLSDEVTTSSGYVTISNILASDDPQVTHIRLYRLGGSATIFTLVTELTNVDQSYEDRNPTIDLPGDLLSSSDNYPPVDGLMFLTEAYAQFFGAKGNVLYISKIGQPDYWPYQIEFSKDITGIGVMPNGVMVYTYYETYTLTGTDPSTFVRYLLASDQGCISHKSVQFVKNTLLWMSTDGLCASNGGSITILSKDKLGKISLTPLASAVYDEVYYLFHKEGILAFDSRFGSVFKYFSDSSVQGAGVFDDILYVSDNENIYEMFRGSSYETLDWLSPVLTEGSYVSRKSYSEGYAIYKGELELKIFIDGELINTHKLNSDKLAKAELGVVTQLNRGYDIQFGVLGTGTLYELDYKGTAYAKQ